MGYFAWENCCLAVRISSSPRAARLFYRDRPALAGQGNPLQEIFIGKSDALSCKARMIELPDRAIAAPHCA
jgi:hypothetical protein